MYKAALSQYHAEYIEKKKRTIFDFFLEITLWPIRVLSMHNERPRNKQGKCLTIMTMSRSLYACDTPYLQRQSA